MIGRRGFLGMLAGATATGPLMRKVLAADASALGRSLAKAGTIDPRMIEVGNCFAVSLNEAGEVVGIIQLNGDMIADGTITATSDGGSVI